VFVTLASPTSGVDHSQLCLRYAFYFASLPRHRVTSRPWLQVNELGTAYFTVAMLYAIIMICSIVLGVSGASLRARVGRQSRPPLPDVADSHPTTKACICRS
jgi:hypothetical protein